MGTVCSTSTLLIKNNINMSLQKSALKWYTSELDDVKHGRLKNDLALET